MRGILHHLPFREPNQETIAKSSKVSTERSYGAERPHELVKPEFYNRARILNRSAARMAMSIFQRRLASSTYALMRSFARRLDKLHGLIAAMQSGQLTTEQLIALQRHAVHDVLEEKTADEESRGDEREANEIAEERTLRVGVVASSLAELEAERVQVQALLELAQRVYDLGEESKFEKLREILQD